MASTLELACALPPERVDRPILLTVRGRIQSCSSVSPYCAHFSSFSFLFKTTPENIIVSPHFANVFLIIHLSKSKPEEMIVINHPLDCSVGRQHGGVCWPGDCN